MWHHNHEPSTHIYYIYLYSGARGNVLLFLVLVLVLVVNIIVNLYSKHLSHKILEHGHISFAPFISCMALVDGYLPRFAIQTRSHNPYVNHSHIRPFLLPFLRLHLFIFILTCYIKKYIIVAVAEGPLEHRFWWRRGVGRGGGGRRTVDVEPDSPGCILHSTQDANDVSPENFHLYIFYMAHQATMFSAPPHIFKASLLRMHEVFIRCFYRIILALLLAI